MIVRFIQHSGVLIEFEDKTLLFDYWKGKLTIPLEKPLYIFVSHRHSDHYTKEVLDFDGIVIADQGVNLPLDPMHHPVVPGDTIQIDDVLISVFGSTDEGVSFLVETNQRKIFHAGDLNLWHWKDESTMDEIEEARIRFENELRLIPDSPLDLAMFPVDPRLGGDFDEGARIFTLKTKPAYFLPLHFSGNAQKVQTFADWIASTATILLRSDQGVTTFEIK
ncbi:MAG: MBL fold metallo-hydrolase [Erysipelotrichaceae bacterium]|nr:MBL fold metallo-hydrolase [Erysipelotrichaceae bacterium]